MLTTRPVRSLALACALVCLAAASGCALFRPADDGGLTASQRYELAVLGYEAAVEAVVLAADAGAIDAEDMARFREFERPAFALLVEIRSRLEGREEPLDALERLERLIDQMRLIEATLDPPADPRARVASAPTNRRAA